MALEPLGHSRTSPIVPRTARGMGTLRALKDIPDGPKAGAWHWNGHSRACLIVAEHPPHDLL